MDFSFVMNDEVSRALKAVEEAKKTLREAVQRAAPEPVEDATLRRPDGSPVRLSALFGSNTELFLWHNMGRSCVYCTLWADGLRGFAEHLQDRAPLVLTSADEPAVLGEFAASRGWTFPCVSAAGTTFLQSLKMQHSDGSPWPGLSALHRNAAGAIVRTGYMYFGPGDDFCPVWPALDLLNGGAGDWSPKYSYGPHVTKVGVERAV